MKRKPSRRRRIVEWTVVAVIALILAAMALPNFVKARTTYSMHSCRFQQMWVEMAKQQWAADNSQPADAVPTADEIVAAMAQVQPRWNGRAHRRAKPRLSADGRPCCPITETPYDLGTPNRRADCLSQGTCEWNESLWTMWYGKRLEALKQ